MSEQAEKSTTSIKSVFQSLVEIFETLQSPHDKLDYALHGNAVPLDEKEAVSDSSPGAITMEMINNKIHQIARRSNDISKMASKLVGN